jgi:hypothetical protein
MIEEKGKAANGKTMDKHRIYAHHHLCRSIFGV